MEVNACAAVVSNVHMLRKTNYLTIITFLPNIIQEFVSRMPSRRPGTSRSSNKREQNIPCCINRITVAFRMLPLQSNS